MFVTGYNNRRIAPGQTFTIFGGFFDGGCSVTLNGDDATIVDYDENMIEVLAPVELGDYEVKLIDGGNLQFNVGRVSVVALADTPRRNAPKDYTEEEFFSYTTSLLPRGNAFALWKGSVFRKLMTAVSGAFKYTWDTIKELMKAVDPTHTENLGDWEEELNLPVLGIYPSDDAGRRAEVYRVECLNGGCSVDYWRQILGLMGIYADIWEFTKNPDKFNGVDFGDDDPRFFSKIDFFLEDYEFKTFEAGVSSAGDYLLDFPLYAEQKVFQEIKPSHTKIVFGYNKNVVHIGSRDYKFKKIGGLIWTTENLDEDVGVNSYYNNDENYKKYGRFYKFDVVNDMTIVEKVSELLSDGWRVPTIDDWKTLLGNYGSDVEDKCAEGQWTEYTTSNKTGFNALPSGRWYYIWSNIGTMSIFLSATKGDASNLGYICPTFVGSKGRLVFNSEVYGTNFAQIRLVKDA